MSRATPRPEGQTPIGPRDVSALVILFAAGLAIRVLVHAKGWGFQYPDERDYLAIARALVEHGTFDAGPDRQWPEVFRAPLLPYVLSALLRAGLGLGALRAAFLAVSALLGPAAFVLLRRLGTPRLVALGGALLFAVHPTHVRASDQLTTDAWACVLAGIALVLLNEVLVRPPGAGLALPLAAGAALGLLGCLRTNLLIFGAPALLILAWRSRSQPGPALRDLAFLAAALLVPVGLFTAIRSSQEGRFLPLSDAGSEIFWRGNSVHTAEYLDGTRSPAEYLQDYRDVVGDAWGRQDASRRAWRAGLSFIVEHPSRWAGLKLKMAWETWRLWPSFQNSTVPESMGRSARFVLDAARVGWALVVDALLLGAIAGCGPARRRPELLALAGILCIATLFGVIFFSEARYRMPLDLALAGLALAGCCGRFMEQGRVRRSAG